MSSAIEAIDVWFSYTKQDYVLRGASLEARYGEILVLLGPTGSGKTTLLLILSGLLKPQKGRVLLDGRSLFDQLPEARRRIGIVFQNPDDQLFNPTVYDEIAYSLRTLGMAEEQIRERVEQVAAMLGIEHLLERQPYRLSMGEKRLVTLASILVYEPQIVVLDEPTTFLDDRGTRKIMCTLLKLRDEGRAVIAATHDLELALWLADKICLLEKGKTKCYNALEAVEERVIERSSVQKTPTLQLVLKLVGGWEKLSKLLEGERDSIREILHCNTDSH